MSVFDGEEHLPETLDTLLAQSWRDFEFVIVDDGSRDGTSGILDAYEARDPRIRRMRNERNLGLPASLNRGLALCRAPLVARADADDLYAPEYLETQVRFLRAHPSVGVVSSAFEVADADGRVQYVRRLPTEDRDIRFGLLFMSRLCHATSVFRADLVREAGGYDESFWTAQDYELWGRLRSRTRFANQAMPLLRYRRHPGATVVARGEAGERLSWRVTQGLLSSYLGAPIGLDEARIARTVYYGMSELTPSDLRRAPRLLGRVLERAREVEDPSVVRKFRQRISGRFMDRSRALAEFDRDTSRFLFWHAMRWRPDAPGVRSLKFLGRLYAPEALVAPTRRVLHRVGRSGRR